ncbi:MAG: DUF1998 domain-containing protein [Desulfobulbaceae bacterium]|nr:DUF1998 domain-containing protein [Desulfobulbaceae bacterium]
MTVMDIRHWTDRNGDVAGQEICHVDLVRSALGISERLRQPPIARELDNEQIDGVCIPATRFPSWMRCTNSACGRLYYRPWQGKPIPKLMRCEQCSKKSPLEQVSWVLIHPDGHMADVPWHRLAHENSKRPEQEKCRGDWEESYLELSDGGGSKRKLRCTRCKAANDFDISIRRPPFFSRCQPWTKDDAPEPTQDTSVMAEIVEINDARIHSPVTVNALVIPPESRIRKGTVVDQLYRSSQNLRKINSAKNPLAQRAALRTLSEELRCSTVEIETAWREIEQGYPLYGKELVSSPDLLLESEYLALLDEIPGITEDEDFVPIHLTSTWKAKAKELPTDSQPRKIVDVVNRLIAVNRLKEIMVLKGFQRLGGKEVPPDIIGKTDWLPAIELYGEGIFFTLAEQILVKWEKNPKLIALAEVFHRRFVSSGIKIMPNIGKVTPRFILLHTLSHLLIRQLEAEAGYPAASLKERIYSTSGTTPMSGILVYVAVPDVVGSLGGLAELADPSRFLKLLSSVFTHAAWCSFDPVCGEHEGQGPALLNRAACHACALVPEPSCAFGNVLLDRTFIKGDVTAGIPSFLSSI